MNSEFMKLGENDFVKGLIVAVLGAALGTIAPAVAAGTLLSMTVLPGAGQAAIVAGMAYLIKNLVTNSDGKIGAETK